MPQSHDEVVDATLMSDALKINWDVRKLVGSGEGLFPEHRVSYWENLPIATTTSANGHHQVSCSYQLSHALRRRRATEPKPSGSEPEKQWSKKLFYDGVKPKVNLKLRYLPSVFVSEDHIGCCHATAAGDVDNNL
ncbi:hypothetical protein NE237_021106 [Protea cynaroides]|uniref:Uncharacterized protein n=1 Tax=Protea cynaroides TaxID=273540 RepID=A0A9Q0H9P3_9MAGN|nr:hypothetical protein NE237_021106 [Protea cynaroides]